MSTVFITGVTGFVGSHLAATLATRGHRVFGSTTSQDGVRSITPGVEHKVIARLGEGIPAIGTDIGHVVHCAWDLRIGRTDANIRGTRAIAEAFATSGAAHQLFVSTYSAHTAAVTEYGRSKLAVEHYMLEHGHAVARLGVVIGSGGIYRKMFDTFTRHLVVPLLDGGRDMVPIVAADDLVQAMASIVERRLIGSYNLYNAERVALRDLLTQTRTAAGSRTRLVSIPSKLVVGPLWMARTIGIHLPLDVDNVRALRANATQHERSDLQQFVERPLTLTEMVSAAAHQRAGSAAQR